MANDPDFSVLEPEMRGTVRLAEAALHAPPPPEHAETQSRQAVEQLMQESALSPKLLREAVREQPSRPWWRFWK